MYNCFTPSVSFCCFRPALHVPLGGRVDMAGRWDGELCAVVPAPRDARPTVMDWQLQVLFFGPNGFNGAGLYGAPAPRPRPPCPPQLVRYIWRIMAIFTFTVTRSALSLSTLDVRCEMAAQSLDVAVARFAIASTVSCWRYPLSGFAVALCAAP